MPTKLIGKSILGDIGFSYNTEVMKDNFEAQLLKVKSELPKSIATLIMTSMTGSEEVRLTNGEYFPKIRAYTDDLECFLTPDKVYTGCIKGLDKFKPGCDFVVWNSKVFPEIGVATFSREAPILAFESDTGKKALGTILRPSLMKYGDYLFSSIKEYLGGDIKVSLVTCNHFEYPEGAIPLIIQGLSLQHDMKCFVCVDSEKDPDCYHRGEKGNHVVAMW